jgi:hypothetical protein
MSYLVALGSFALLSHQATSYSIPTGRDYSCYHKQSWLENRDEHYNDVFSAYTNVLKSEFYNSTLQSHQAPGHKQEHHAFLRSFIKRASAETSPPGNNDQKPSANDDGQEPHNGDGSGGQKPKPPPNGGSGGGGQNPPPNGGGSGGGGQNAPPNGSGGDGHYGPGGPGGHGGHGGSQPSDATVTTGWNVTFSGIPNYDHRFSSTEVSSLNSRPKAASDFKNGHTSAAAGDMVAFGGDIGYSSAACSTSYWPPGMNFSMHCFF